MARAPSNYSNSNNVDTDNRLYDIFTKVLCDLVTSDDGPHGIIPYVHDQALRQTIETALMKSRLVKNRNRRPPRRNKLINEIKKEKNGAWEIKLGDYFRRRSVYIGFEIDVPQDYYDEAGYDAMIEILKGCPKQVREIAEKQKQERQRRQGHNDDEKQNNKRNSSNDGQGNSDLDICYLCQKPSSVTPPFDRHICRVKASFRCKNSMCRATWSTVRGFIDPETEAEPRNGESYCKYCHYRGKMIKYDLNTSTEATGEHLHELRLLLF